MITPSYAFRRQHDLFQSFSEITLLMRGKGENFLDRLAKGLHKGIIKFFVYIAVIERESVSAFHQVGQ